MSDYSARMAARLIADHERYMTRQEREDALLSNDDTSRAALADWTCERLLLRGIGSVNAPRRYRNTVPGPRTRVVGGAAPSDNPEHIARLAAGDVNPTARVIRNGVDTIVPASNFHADRKRRTTRVTIAPTVTDTARFSTGHDFNE